MINQLKCKTIIANLDEKEDDKILGTQICKIKTEKLTSSIRPEDEDPETVRYEKLSTLRGVKKHAVICTKNL